MCFRNEQPRPPEIARVAPPPPPKPLQIAQTSTAPRREVTKPDKKPVKYGAKSLRGNKKETKRDAASLLIPMNSGDSKGGINA